MNTREMTPPELHCDRCGGHIICSRLMAVCERCGKFLITDIEEEER